MVKKVPVKNAILKIPTGYIGHIGRFIPGKVKVGDLPIPVTIVDHDTGDEFKVQLISILPFTTNIPEILAYHAESEPPHICTPKLLERANVPAVNHLAYYLYENLR